MHNSLSSAEIRALYEKLDSDPEEPISAPYDDDQNFIPNNENEESDANLVPVVEYENKSSSSSDSEEAPDLGEELKAKDGTVWNSQSFPQCQALRQNILRQKSGPSSNRLLTIKEVFKTFITPEMCDIIIRCSNRKAALTYQQCKDNKNVFENFNKHELDAFLGILIAAGVHKSNKEHAEELWKKDALPIYKASMSRDRFKQFERFIRFDNKQTRAERAKTDKAAPIRDIWEMFNFNLFKDSSQESVLLLTNKLFPFREHTKVTQYIPSKPAKYGIKVFWACDAETSYPLKGLLYTGKPIDGDRQVNVGERTVLDLVEKYIWKKCHYR